MAKSRKSRAISQKNDSTSIGNRRGMSRRAKRNASKKERRDIKQETKMLEIKVEDTQPWMEYEEKAWCPTCGAPHELVRPGKTQPTCICHLICEGCGGRMVYFSWGEDPKHPNMAGEWCPRCGPFYALENYNG